MRKTWIAALALLWALPAGAQLLQFTKGWEYRGISVTSMGVTNQTTSAISTEGAMGQSICRLNITTCTGCVVDLQMEACEEAYTGSSCSTWQTWTDMSNHTTTGETWYTHQSSSANAAPNNVPYNATFARRLVFPPIYRFKLINTAGTVTATADCWHSTD